MCPYLFSDTKIDQEKKMYGTVSEDTLKQYHKNIQRIKNIINDCIVKTIEFYVPTEEILDAYMNFDEIEDIPDDYEEIEDNEIEEKDNITRIKNVINIYNFINGL